MDVFHIQVVGRDSVRDRVLSKSLWAFICVPASQLADMSHEILDGTHAVS